MKKQTILQLNQLNKDFYNKISKEFSQTRSYYWNGWHKLSQFLREELSQHTQPTILDLGCGNGRFAEFLQEILNGKKFSYVGCDNSEKLLSIAQEKITLIIDDAELKKLDLVKTTLDDSLQEKLNHKRYHLITLFGVMHHIPSADLRISLLQQLSHLLNHNGLIIFTAWQFQNDQRVFERQSPPNKIGLDESDLEAGDYILDWRKGKVAYRYCHQTDHRELENIIAQSNMDLVDQFYADGKTDQLNFYVILRKKAVEDV
ncbi:MAG: class I SAM-dependent methyltransferase [Patescibacteria group bacterium]